MGKEEGIRVRTEMTELTRECIYYYRKDSNQAGQQLVQWKAWNLWCYEPCVHKVTGLIIGAEFSAQTTLAGIPAIIMTHVKSIAIICTMFVNRIATNAVKTSEMNSCW